MRVKSLFLVVLAVQTQGWGQTVPALSSGYAAGPTQAAGASPYAVVSNPAAPASVTGYSLGTYTAASGYRANTNLTRGFHFTLLPSSTAPPKAAGVADVAA